MAIVTTDNQYYSAIAAVIRQKLGVDTRYRPAEMAAAIARIGAAVGIPLLFAGSNLVTASGTLEGQPLEGLKVFGRTVRSADPAGLVNAAQGGTIALSVTGNNLFDPQTALAAQIAKGLAAVNESGEVVLNGTIDTGNRDFYVSLGPGTYYFAEESSTFHLLSPRDGFWNCDVTATGKTEYKCYVSSQTYDGTVLRPMVNIGDAALPWEPYNGRTITVTVPEGLAGIPVDSGGNYTDAAGQQYLCDWLDFAAGVEHICCGRIASYGGEEIAGSWLSSTGALTEGAQVVYALPEPQTRAISSNEMALYRALTSCPGTTILSTPEQVAGMEVTLRCDPDAVV